MTKIESLKLHFSAHRHTICLKFQLCVDNVIISIWANFKEKRSTMKFPASLLKLKYKNELFGCPCSICRQTDKKWAFLWLRPRINCFVTVFRIITIKESRICGDLNTNSKDLWSSRYHLVGVVVYWNIFSLIYWHVALSASSVWNVIILRKTRSTVIWVRHWLGFYLHLCHACLCFRPMFDKSVISKQYLPNIFNMFFYLNILILRFPNIIIYFASLKAKKKKHIEPWLLKKGQKSYKGQQKI